MKHNLLREFGARSLSFVHYVSRALVQTISKTIKKIVPSLSASVAAFLLLAIVFQPLAVVFAEENLTTASNDVVEEISKGSVRKALQADKITKEEVKDIIENRPAVSTITEPDFQSALFVFDENKSVQEEVALLR